MLRRSFERIRDAGALRSGPEPGVTDDALAEKVYRAEKKVTWIRVAVIVFNTIAYLLLLDPERGIPWLAWTIIFVANPYAFYVVLFEPYRRYPVLLSSYFTTVSDGVLIAAWVLATGGVASPFFVIWYLSITAIAFRYGYTETLLTSVVYAASYIAILVPFHEIAGHEAELIVRTVYIFLCGAISALIGSEVYEQTRAKFEMRHRMEAAEAAEVEIRRLLTEVEHGRAAAEAASVAKGEFVANMSHEIRTPLNAVIGMTDILLDTELSDDQRDYASTIRSAADTLLALINDILDFSRLDARQVPLERIPFDLQHTVERTSDLLAPKAVAKGFDLLLRWAPGTPQRVFGDPGRIRQVLMNLAGNAIKFTSRGHVLIEVESKEAADGFAEFRFTVTDTGIGIAEDKLGEIFERFTQADGSTTRKYGGTGLGLAISKQLVELMGGRIGVESHLGSGSLFHFSLPLELDTSVPEAAGVAADLAGLRVLIVDDNPVNRRILDEQIERMGARVSQAASGEEAYAALEAADATGEGIDIAILDYQMPGLDGATLARRIKQAPRLRHVVLLLLTSAGQRGEAQRMADCGFAAYLLKPLHASTLGEAMRAAWATRSDPGAGLITRHTIAERRESASASPASESQNRVLLVEDNETNRRVARMLLEKLGCTVDDAHDGREAVDKVLSGGYDLVLMDCQMPEMDGYEATAEIRRHEANGRHLPIVAMTAHALDNDRRRCLDAGMDDYLSKPVQRDALRTTLVRWLPALTDRPA